MSVVSDSLMISVSVNVWVRLVCGNTVRASSIISVCAKARAFVRSIVRVADSSVNWGESSKSVLVFILRTVRGSVMLIFSIRPLLFGAPAIV